MEQHSFNSTESLWVATAPATDYSPVSEELAVDVAVIGGGIAGLTVAALLKKGGRTAAVLESERVGQGVSGHSTVKVTAGHAVTGSSLARRLGREAGRAYVASNQTALERIASFVAARGIDCDFERTDNYVYAESAEEVERLEEEAALEKEAGLAASLVSQTSLPFEVAGALRLKNQAQFHPCKYLAGLAGLVQGDGSRVFERTRALGVEEGDPCVVTTSGGRVLAEAVVVATHFPILNRGLWFTKIFPRREYAVAGPVDPGRAPVGMHINIGTPKRSLRTVAHEGGRLLIVVGEDHKTGEEPDTSARYRALEAWATEHFGVTSFPYRWSTQDNDTMDGLPFIGPVSRRSEHVFVATGFGGWGMTNGTLAGMILSDRILDRPNAWAALYDTSRLNVVQSAPAFLAENAKVAAHWVGDRVRRRPFSAGHLANGEAAIFRSGLEQVAAYRDEDGQLHTLSAACTHLGCTVAWNAAERTWDCPCHGSRFDYTGRVVHPPAVKPLRKRDLQ